MRSTSLISLIPFIQGALGATEVSGGTSATIKDHPYLVSIARAGYYTCAGVLIASNRVVTSAQCVYGHEASPTDFSVRYGSSKTSSEGSVVRVSKISRNPSFQPSTNDYDVAVLQLVSSITPSSAAQPLGSDGFIERGQDPADGTACVASGWGDIEGQLQSVTLPIVSRDSCNELSGGEVTSREICAGGEAGKGTCPGDRGGPLICNGKLAGIISQTNGCDLLGLPDIFTDFANSNIQRWVTSQ